MAEEPGRDWMWSRLGYRNQHFGALRMEGGSWSDDANPCFLPASQLCWGQGEGEGVPDPLAAGLGSRSGCVRGLKTSAEIRWFLFSRAALVKVLAPFGPMSGQKWLKWACRKQRHAPQGSLCVCVCGWR